MAEVYFNSDINIDGKVKLSTVPNGTGTVITYNSTTKELSTRTNAQIISDLGLDGGGLSSYVKKAGDTMTGALIMNNGVNTVINKDLSTITAGSGFARDLFRLTGTNGIVDTMGWQGTVDSSGNITTFGYGYLGGAAYNVKNAIRWNSNQQVRIGSTGVPGGNYTLEVDGNTLSRGGYDSQNGYFNTVSGELLVQRFGVNRIRTNTASLILSGDTSNGIVYIRPQGDAVATSEVQFRSNLTAVFPSTYNLYFGNQASEGGSIFHTNQANTTFGYGMWMNYNLQHDGTNFIQPRGSGVTSFAFTANQHKGFSFNIAPPNGTNGGIVNLTEVVRFGSSGTITTLNDGNSAQWNSAYTNGFTYKSLIAVGTDLNTITTSGWYVQASNANALTSLNYPVANMAGQLRVYGGNAVHMVQEYTTYSTNNDIYRRYYFNGTWSPWTKDWDSNDFSQTNISSWNNIALNGATQQWVDQYYINKSTQNVVKKDDWFITSDFSAGMEDRISFKNGYVTISWDNSSMIFTDEGVVDLHNYGIRQNDDVANTFNGDTTFKGVNFSNAQGTSPFNVTSSTLVTNLNADLLDGRHASDFMLSNQAGNYIDKASTNSVLLDNWSIIGNTSYPDKGYFKFKSPYGYPEIGFGDSNLQFTDEGLIDLNNYGFRQNNIVSNYFQGDTTFKGVYFSNAQGITPFIVTSNTLVTNLNADLLDGYHANAFAQASSLANYVPTSRTLTINGTTFDLSANRTWNIPVGSTYTAGAGLTLTGTQFSLPVTQTGIGNAVTSVTQTANGITVNKGDSFATTTDLGNYISKSPLQFRSVADTKNATGVDFFYAPSSDPSKPIGVVDGALLNMTYDNSLWNTQIYSDWRTNEWYVRVKSNGNWGNWQKLYHDGNLNPSAFVPTSRTITINGQTQDLSADRAWTTPNTVTRLRGGGSFVSGDITISAGANTTVSQSGQNITISSTDTNTTYTAGSGLTLSGTTFSLPVTISGTGNGVASVVQNATGITVNKTDFALSSDLTNFVTVTGAGQTITSPKTFNANVNVNATLQANGLLGNASQSNNEVWTTDGGYRDLTEIVRVDGQWRLDIDGNTTAINLRPYHDLGVVIYEGGGIEDTAVALPRITRQGQEAQVINRGNAVVFVTKVGSSVLIPVDPGMTLRFVFTLDNNVGDITDDKEGLGTWVHVASEKYTEL